ncbi:MarR family winged helix-turn-helix transcriptional regulator [Labedaea rhizosphaerae]|uniref:DNA-binding MarR family transcriptional regulator n=1 Tax=Labedaea rhizosphaerae TaxID=598644 RepID=A0A4R6SIB0_LABRH|nr:MarR family transcriptional regulator [Labedaea rhizosphaerae]TDQ01377.1 DNA-binding MarR family transcriptional regulator [Labedaea rhizosphaerae]
MDSELADLVHRVGRRLKHGYAAGFAPLGLSPGQARALGAIARAGEPLRMVQLADALRIAPRSVTSVIDSLEEAGFVRRDVDPANRRSTLVSLTREGQDAVTEVAEIRRDVATHTFGVLTEEQQGRLADLLRAVDAD